MIGIAGMHAADALAVAGRTDSPYLRRMQNRLSTVERALELARGGTHHRVDDIRRQLTQEGFDNVSAHLSGSFARQLKQVMSSN